MRVHTWVRGITVCIAHRLSDREYAAYAAGCETIRIGHECQKRLVFVERQLRVECPLTIRVVGAGY